MKVVALRDAKQQLSGCVVRAQRERVLINFLGSPSCLDSTSDTSCFTSWHPFAISSGFTSGVNTLEFDVLNGLGPSGLRVEVAGTVDPVPEPGTLLLLGSGLTALAVRRRRKA